MASPAFGGGGTGEVPDGAVGCRTAPGWGGGGVYVGVVAVGIVVVGVAVRLAGCAVPVWTGRLGAAPGWAVAPGCAVA